MHYAINYQGGVITIYEKIKSEYNKLQIKISELEMQLAKLPPGKLIWWHYQERCKWYQSDGHHKVYIPKNNRVLAQKLAAKKFLTDSSEYQKLRAPYFTPLSEELSNWMNSPYERNTLYPEQLIHKSISGNFLRFKSEAMIDMFLYVNKIHFRYVQNCSFILLIKLFHLFI